jgi:hypothetical protein
MGRETDSLHLLAPLLLTGGKGADLVIRGNVVLNSLEQKQTQFIDHRLFQLLLCWEFAFAGRGGLPAVCSQQPLRSPTSSSTPYIRIQPGPAPLLSSPRLIAYSHPKPPASPLRDTALAASRNLIPSRSHQTDPIE